jgi:hypothetical protein
MTQDAVATDVARSLAEARPVYDELARLQARVAALRTVEDARLAYDALLHDDTRAIADVRRDRDTLALEQRRRRLTIAPVAPPPPRPKPRPLAATPGDTAPTEPPPRLQTPDRRKLKKLVSRWQFAWALDPGIIAQVNSIADDTDRPLGEALALLEWRLYETPIPGESTDGHAARVREWREILAAYAEHLRADIDTTETQYRSLLAIWERWSNARASDDGRAEWNRFIDATRAQKRSELATLTAEVTTLREELGL